ncbi:tannase and feruloyl esterase [Geopyxis carbonaria]|nr:tannase and feruloyl esterase [Geopyxis carbonaria]KAI5795222.1 tannase and feruloyl esterase [Geopyxis carbonaria]
MNYFLLLSLSLVAAATPGTSRAGEAACSAIASHLKIDDTTITGANYLPKNTTFTIPNAHPTCSGSATADVPLCRVQMTTATSDDSRVITELWLPDTFTTARRVASTGNGGLNGCIDYSTLAYLSSMGFAAIGSDNGHTGMTGEPFLNHPEVIIDFAHRSIHVETQLAKQVARAYYGVPHKKSYYVGCSTGGRQGFKAIQEYPTDFDGVLVGAPAIDFNHLVGWSAAMSIHGGAPGSETFIPAPLLAAVAADAITQCDEADGVKDGIIDDPSTCDYTPSAALKCTVGTTETTACLTAAQLTTVQKYFEPLKNEAGGLLYPRFDPGTPFSPMMFSGSFFFFAADWYKYTVYNESTLVFPPAATNFSLPKAIADTDVINPGSVAAWEPSRLSAFAARGGKVLTYHGRADGLISGANSVRWYDAVRDSMGARRMDKFYRFFSVPGMDHCAGGAGTGFFGQTGMAREVPANAEYNAVMALVAWVEGNYAPDELVGTNTQTGATRRLCAYPKKSVLKTGGDWQKAADWECT